MKLLGFRRSEFRLELDILEISEEEERHANFLKAGLCFCNGGHYCFMLHNLEKISDVAWEEIETKVELKSVSYMPSDSKFYVLGRYIEKNHPDAGCVAIWLHEHIDVLA